MFWKNLESELERLVPDSGLPSLTPREVAPLWIGALIFLLVGYALFYAFWLVEYPPDDSPFMARVTEKIAALRKVDRVARATALASMPMKVVMLYVHVGTLLLTVWGTVWSLQPNVMRTVLTRCKHGAQPTWKLVPCALCMPIFIILFYQVMNYESKAPLSRSDVVMYVSTLGSLTKLLLFSAATAATLCFYIPLCVHLISIAIARVRKS